MVYIFGRSFEAIEVVTPGHTSYGRYCGKHRHRV